MIGKPRVLTARQLALMVALFLPVLFDSARSHPHFTASVSPPPGFTHLETSARVAALTFDDGPDSRFTPRILDELKRRGVRATFFLIGEQIARHRDVARRIVAEGHVIGNHSYTHPQLERLPNRLVDSELASCDDEIRRLGARAPRFFRPPQGDLSPTVVKVGWRRGYAIVNWTVCADSRDAPTPEEMAQRVVKAARPGMIVLIHDGRTKSREKDVQALPLIIEGLQKLGYRFITLEES